MLYMSVLHISEKHPQNFICIVLNFHKTPHSEDNCKSMLSIMDDSSITAFLKNMKELAIPGSQLQIETSLTGSDSTVTNHNQPITHTPDAFLFMLFPCS